MIVRATFRVRLDSDRMLDETHLASPAEADRRLLRSMRDFEGVLDLQHDGARIGIEDSLEACVQNICYDAVTRLVALEPVEIAYFTYAGSLRLSPSDSAVTITGDHVPTVAFDRRQLLPALVCCGDRFLAWARNLKREDGDYLLTLDDVASFRHAAVTALRENGLAGPEA